MSGRHTDAMATVLLHGALAAPATTEELQEFKRARFAEVVFLVAQHQAMPMEPEMLRTLISEESWRTYLQYIEGMRQAMPIKLSIYLDPNSPYALELALVPWVPEGPPTGFTMKIED